MRWANIAVLLVLAATPTAARGQAPTAQNGQNAAAAVYITRERAFSFPISMPAAGTLGGEPAIIELWFSTDRGANWRKYDARRPDAGVFVVQTDRDGEYWFASRILDALNRVLYQPPQLPERQVIVDTVPPRLEFAAAAGASGEVQGQWQAMDEYLQPDSLTLEYQPGPNQPWRPLTFDRAPPSSTQTTVTGAATWFPHTLERAVTLRAVVYDRAGNSTVMTRTVVFSPTPLAASPPHSPSPQNPAPVQPIAPQQPPYQQPMAPPGNVAAVPMNSQGMASPQLGAKPQANIGAFPIGANSSAENMSAFPVPRSAVEPIPWPDENPATAGAPAFADDYPSTDTTHRVSPVADDGGMRRASSSPAPPIGPDALPGGERPRMTNSRKFQLEYDVTSVGSQGVSRVELWITRDGGRNWQAWGTDPDRQSPMDVSLDQEGVYGFRVVVTGRNGLSGQIPTAGEMADVWIGIDTTAPTASLTAAKYGAGNQAGQLDIRWDADDMQLAARPVTLLFGETPNGPWTIVAAGLPNTGSHNWAVDPRTPQQIYLRLEVRDEAGNLGVDQLREPISLQGLEPKARVRGIRPVGEIGLNPARSVLFR